MQLRGYQARGLDQLDDLGNDDVCLVAPTGAGKTVVFLGYQQRYPTQKIMFIVHSGTIINQTYAKLKALGVDVSVVKSKDKRYRKDAQVQVCSVQTLVRRKKLPFDPDVLFIDEAHRSLAKSYVDVRQRYPRARLIGLTATPCRLDNRGLGDMFKHLVIVATYSELLAAGHLVVPRIFTSQSIATRARIVKGDYDPKQAAKDFRASDIAQHFLQSNQPGHRSVIFASTCEHSEKIVESLSNVGIRAMHLDAHSSEEQRVEAISKLEKGEIDTISNVGILTEGFDLPELDAVYLWRITKSLSLYMQMCGRVLRTAPGKTTCIVYDRAGNVHEHGSPIEDREWTLETTEKKDKDDVEELRLKICPKCGALNPPNARTCQECAEEIRAEQIEDKEHKVANDAVTEICTNHQLKKYAAMSDGVVKYKCTECGISVKKNEAIPAGSRAFFDEKMRIALYRGYKPQWASFQFRNRYGMFPPWKWIAESQSSLDSLRLIA